MFHIRITVECSAICEYISRKTELNPTLHIIFAREDICGDTSCCEWIERSKGERLGISCESCYNTGITRIVFHLELIGADFFLADGMCFYSFGFETSPYEWIPSDDRAIAIDREWTHIPPYI